VIQQLCVEADTIQALKGAIMIAMVENKKVTHFRVEQLTEKPLTYEKVDSSLIGANRLTLLWARDNQQDNELPFELNTVEEVTDFVTQWLEKKAEWPTEKPDTDGSVDAGFRVENSRSPFYTVVKITPTWIVYGK
jgi:hypothetical protein